MRNIPALNTVTNEGLDETRRQLYLIYTRPETPDHERGAAAVLYNFYAAEIDARMVNAEYGIRGTK